MRRRVGLLLSGCGAYDGTDPHEATLIMLALQERGCDVVPMALERPQFHTVDHASGQETPGTERDQFVESARLVRGKLYPVSEISPKLLDAVVIPGGQGPAKNFMTGFGTLEARGAVPEVATFLRELHEAGGIIAAVSLAEFLVSELFGPWSEGKGCFDIPPEEVLVDVPRRLMLSPGNTQASNLPQLKRGIERLCEELIILIDSRR